jgi:hypothetical protein
MRIKITYACTIWIRTTLSATCCSHSHLLQIPQCWTASSLCSSSCAVKSTRQAHIMINNTLEEDDLLVAYKQLLYSA